VCEVVSALIIQDDAVGEEVEGVSRGCQQERLYISTSQYN